MYIDTKYKKTMQEAASYGPVNLENYTKSQKMYENEKGPFSLFFSVFFILFFLLPLLKIWKRAQISHLTPGARKASYTTDGAF